ncbi:protein of unknown function [Nitrospira japonica]|uniref:Uncharacterized protein n=1 Tax=Nitrospira japonica TaxID=1325564 RepID=A0A1W1I0V1_9BACT|nr:protein of unknown function [Nitrospira japonica]
MGFANYVSIWLRSVDCHMLLERRLLMRVQFLIHRHALDSTLCESNSHRAGIAMLRKLTERLLGPLHRRLHISHHPPPYEAE